MQGYLQILAFVIIGVVLLWFGFSIFAGQWEKIRLRRWFWFEKPQSDDGTVSPGDPQACPICSTKLNKGELVKTHAFPSITGGKDRLMHIQGCAFCINGNLERKCPVCGTSLSINDMLIARIFERPHRRSHVHIMGCNKCRWHGAM